MAWAQNLIKQKEHKIRDSTTRKEVVWLPMKEIFKGLDDAKVVGRRGGRGKKKDISWKME